jgi:hypothetical protein
MKITPLFLSLFAAAAVIGCTAQGSVNIGGNTTPSASPSPSPSSGASVGANVGVNVGVGGSTSGSTAGSTSGSASTTTTNYVAEMNALSACLKASGAAGVSLASAVDGRISLVQMAMDQGNTEMARQQYELSKNTIASTEGQYDIDCVK